MAQIQTLHYVEVDEQPTTYFGDYTPEYRDLPQNFLVRLSEVIDEPDGYTCATCGRPIGYVLSGDPESMTWRMVILVAQEVAGPVVAVCEDCHPAPVFPEPQKAGEGS